MIIGIKVALSERKSNIMKLSRLGILEQDCSRQACSDCLSASVHFRWSYSMRCWVCICSSENWNQITRGKYGGLGNEIKWIFDRCKRY